MSTTYTDNYNLGMQEDPADKFNMSIITENMKTIDEQMKANETNEGEDRTALAELVDSGAKNVISFSEIGTNNSHGSTYASNGVEYTLNSDFTITVERTATSTVDSSCNLRIDTGSLYIDDWCNGNYVLSGCPEGGGDSTYSLRALRGDDYRVSDTGEGVVLPDKGTNSSIYINMLVMAAFEGTATFKPMVCKQAAWKVSQAHQPFRPSYQELYERILALEGGTVQQRSVPPATIDTEDALDM